MNRKLKKRYKLLNKYTQEILKVAPEFSDVFIFEKQNHIACYNKNNHKQSILILLNNGYKKYHEIAVTERRENRKDMKNFHGTYFYNKNQIGVLTTELLQKLFAFNSHV